MNDQDGRVPFDRSTSNVTSIRPDKLAVDALCPDEVTATLDSLDWLISAYGFDNVALHVADALIDLRVRMDVEQLVLAEDIEQRLAGFEQRVRDFNKNRSTDETQP